MRTDPVPRPLQFGFTTPEERNGCILNLRQTGRSAQEVAEQFGLAVSTVRLYAWRAAKARGLNRQQKLGPFPDKRSRDMWIYNQWRWGMLRVEIARCLDITKQMVGRTIKFLDTIEQAERVCWEDRS